MLRDSWSVKRCRLLLSNDPDTNLSGGMHIRVELVAEWALLRCQARAFMILIAVTYQTTALECNVFRQQILQLIRRTTQKEMQDGALSFITHDRYYASCYDQHCKRWLNRCNIFVVWWLKSEESGKKTVCPPRTVYSLYSNLNYAWIYHRMNRALWEACPYYCCFHQTVLRSLYVWKSTSPWARSRFTSVIMR